MLSIFQPPEKTGKGEKSLWHLVGAFFLVALNAFFVASEFALVKTRRTRLQELVDEGDPRAKTAMHINENLNAYLTANQVGITLASLGLGWIGQPAVQSILRPLFDWLGTGISEGAYAVISMVFAFLFITFLHTVLGELVPKSIAISQSESVSLRLAGPLRFFYVAAFPLITVLNGAANIVTRALGHDPDASEDTGHSVEELRMIVWAIREQGEILPSTEKLLTNLLDYRKRTARELMTPRNEVNHFRPDMPAKDAFELAMDAEYSRYPLFAETSAFPIGFVLFRDLVRLHVQGQPDITLRSIVRNAPIVPESMPGDRIRQLLQRARTHIALVVDEFGDFVGIVTMEDILEEIVGQIQDELDRETPEITRLGPKRWLVDGSILLENAEKEFDVNLRPHPDGMDTLAGYILTQLGRMAKEGDIVRMDTHEFRVVRLDELRIETIRVDALEPPEEGSAEDPEPSDS